MDLPIDLVSTSVTPPHFRWRQVVDTPVGMRVIDHEGLLPPNIEGAVFALVGIAKQLSTENEALKRVAATTAAVTKSKK